MKVLQIGTFPPPMCGWAIQTVLLHQELQRRGCASAVLNINENRKKPHPDYIDVQNGVDYLRKVIRFARQGYLIYSHVNGESTDLYLLALLAAIVGRILGRPIAISMHGGLPQTYFPRRGAWRFAFQLLFRLAGQITCDSDPIKAAIVAYGVQPDKIAAIPCFSSQLLNFSPAVLGPEVDSFLAVHDRVFLCYVSFRPEYRLPVLREGMLRIRELYPRSGFIWLGFPQKEMAGIEEHVASWPANERESLLLLGNLQHDAFLTLMRRCFACLRTPACDGVSASVLEALALGVPVIASENGRRPEAVVTYSENDAADMCAKVAYVVENYEHVKQQTRLERVDDNTSRTVDYLLRQVSPAVAESARAS